MKNNAVLEVRLDKVDMGYAARVAQWFVLQEIYLVDAKVSRDPLIMSPEALSLEHRCSSEFIGSDENKNHSFIGCNFRVVAFDTKSPDKVVMKIEASFCTSYVMKSPLPPGLIIPDIDGCEISWVVYWAIINPISHAWPYWREFVQSMSTRMGFPALTVPLLEIAAKKTETKKVKSQPAKKESKRRKKISA